MFAVKKKKKKNHCSSTINFFNLSTNSKLFLNFTSWWLMHSAENNLLTEGRLNIAFLF